jgi:hypothetical protein
VNQSTATTRLDARYGRSVGDSRRQKIIGTLAGVAVAIVLIAWVWWAGLLQPTAQFQARDLGYQFVDDQNITVQFEITVSPNTPMACAVQALNAEYGIVGWRIVDIPASEQRTRVFEQPLRTSEKPVTGLLYRCWVT